MSIRARLTVWYAGVLLLSVLVTSGLLYHELKPERPAGKPSRHVLEHDDEAEEGGHSENAELAQFFFWGTVPAVLLAVTGGWWLTRRSLAPISRLTAAAEKIHDENLQQRLPRSGNGDELDRLAEVFNAMIARLDHSFQRVREFTLHASHELKTPLTILHGEIEAVQRDSAIPAAARERLGGQLDEIQRISIIVDNLTLLTKADAGQMVLDLQPLRFDEIVREVYEETRILAEPSALAVSFSQCQPLTVRGDRRRLRQLLLNLVENAVKYNEPGGTVDFSLRAAGPQAQLIIANTGKGIAPEDLPRVFERFYQCHPGAHSHVDGCGLGLSIVQSIAHAHRGSVSMESEPGKLTTVTVNLPMG
ncbi:MAG TPA: ATP-binding protein [Verrucomicrobiae bacterium]